MPITFVLNDETETNSYGFRLSNSGLNLNRFKNNPIMLDYHRHGNDSVIGRWENIRFEGTALKADAVFDTDDEEANKIKGKVDRGFIKGTSLGLLFDAEKMKVSADGTLVLTASEVSEASIVPVPSNAGALKLYAKETGELLSKEEIKLSVQDFKKTITKKEDTMENFELSAGAITALGIEDGKNAEDVSKAILTLHKKLEAEKKVREALEGKLTAQKDQQAEALVEQAITEGKLTATVKDQFLEMAKSNYELASKVIGGMPGKESLAGQVHNSGSSKVETMDDFQKLSLEEQLAFKENNPEKYGEIVA